MNRTIDVMFRLRLDTAADAAVAASFTKMRANLKSAKTDARSLTEEMRKLMLAEQDAGSASPGGASSGGRSLGERAETGLKSLGRGFSGIGGGQFGELGKVGSDILQISNTLGGLGVVAAPLAGAIIGVQVGMQILNAELVQGGANLKIAVAGVHTYFEAIQNGTTESVAKKKKEAEDNLAIEQANLDTLKNARQKAFDAEVARLANTGPLADFGARITTGIAGFTQDFGDMNKQISDSETKVKELTGTVDSLGRASDDAAVKMRTQLQGESAGVDKFIADQKAYQNELKQSSTVLKTRVQDITNERAAIQAGIEAERQSLLNSGAPLNEENTAHLKALQQTFDDLGTESVRLKERVLPLVLAQEDAAAKTKQIADDFEKAAKQLDEINKLNEAHAKELAAQRVADERASISAGFEKRIAQAKEYDDAANAAQEQAQQLQKINLDTAKRTQQATESYQTDSLKALQSYLLAEQRATDAYAKQRRRTIEDLNDNLNELAAEGDIAGFIQAQKAGEKELKRQTEDADDAAKQRAEDYANQNRERRDQFDKELRDIREENAQKLQDQQEAHQTRVNTAKALEDQFAAQRLEWQRIDEQNRRNAESAGYAARLAELQGQVAKETSTIKTFFDSAYNYARGVVTNLNSLFFGQSQSTPGSNQGHLGGITPLATGIDNVPRGGLMGLLHPGEAVLNADAASQWRNGGSASISIGEINIGAGNAVTRADVEQAFQSFAEQIVLQVRAQGRPR